MSDPLITKNDMGVNEVLARLDERSQGMADAFDEMKDRVSQIYHVLLEGNGTPPITVQLATLRAEVDELKGKARDYRIPRGVWVGIVFSAVIGLAGIVTTIAIAVS